MKLVVDLAVVAVPLVTLVVVDMVEVDADMDVALLVIILADVAMGAMVDTLMLALVTMVGVRRRLLLQAVEDMVVVDVVVDLDVVMDVAMVDAAMDVAVDEVAPVARWVPWLMILDMLIVLVARSAVEPCAVVKMTVVLLPMVVVSIPLVTTPRPRVKLISLRRMCAMGLKVRDMNRHRKLLKRNSIMVGLEMSLTLLVSGVKMKLVAMEIIEMNGGNGTILVMAMK